MTQRIQEGREGGVRRDDRGFITLMKFRRDMKMLSDRLNFKQREIISEDKRKMSLQNVHKQ